MRVQLVILGLGLLLGQISALDDICTGDTPTQIITHPHPSDCTLYYECFGGNATLLECPPGLWFNAQISSCDFPPPDGVCRRTTTTEEPTTTTEQPTTTTEQAGGGNTGSDPRCISGAIDYFPHPSDCSKYIECFMGDSYEMQCPDGLYFHATEKHCVHASEADCTDYENTEPPLAVTTPDPLCYGVLPGQVRLSRYDGDCRKYWECIGSHPTVGQCPPGLFFDSDRGMCDFEDLVDCDDSTRTADPSTVTPPVTGTEPPAIGVEDPRCQNGEVSYWPGPPDGECDVYIQCYNDTSYERRCPPGLYFDGDRVGCVDPALAGCSDNATTTVNPNTSTGQPDDRCLDVPDDGERYLFPYVGDCTKFVECWRGVTIVAVCPPGMWFNPTLLVCDYPYAAGCEYGTPRFYQRLFESIYGYFY